MSYCILIVLLLLILFVYTFQTQLLIICLLIGLSVSSFIDNLQKKIKLDLN